MVKSSGLIKYFFFKSLSKKTESTDRPPSQIHGTNTKEKTTKEKEKQLKKEKFDVNSSSLNYRDRSKSKV